MIGTAPRRREITGGGTGGLGYEEPNNVFSALSLLASVAMIAGAEGSAAPALAVPPLAVSAQSEAFPTLGSALCKVLRTAVDVRPCAVKRNARSHCWTNDAKCRAEKVAQVFGLWGGERFLSQVAIAVLHLSRDPFEISWPLDELADHIGVREDAAQLAVDLLTGKSSLGAAPTRLPAGGGSLPGKPGKYFSIRTGEEVDRPDREVFPAKAIMVRAKNGNPQACEYVRKLAAVAPLDREAAWACGALRRADKEHELDLWREYYGNVFETLRVRDPRVCDRIRFVAGLSR